MTARSTVGLLLVAWVLSNTATAQPGRGFRGTPSIFDSLRKPEIAATLAITDEERQKLEALEEAPRPSFTETFRAVSEENPDASGDELRELTAEKLAEAKVATEQKVAELLGKERAAKLKPLVWKVNGPAALFGRDAADFLELDDETRDELRGMSREYLGARFRLGRDASDEQRSELDEEWAGKLTAILSDEQRQKWTSTLASVEVAAVDESNSAPATTDDTESASKPPTEPPAETPRTTEVKPPFDPAAAVVSFGSASQQKRDPNAPFSFNFRRAPWAEVLELFAEQANLTLDPEVVPAGEFSYVDDKSYDATGALDVLNGYLLPKGFVLVRRDDFLVCVDLSQPVPPNMVPNVSLEELGKRGRNELVSVVIPLAESADPKNTAEEVKAVLGAYGKADPLSVASAIVVRDTAGNAERIARWLTGVEDVDLQATEFQRFVLEHISATDAEPIIREQLGAGSGVRNVSIGGSIRSSSLEQEGPPGTVFVQRGGGSDEDRRRMFYEMMKRRREEEERRRDDDRGRSSSRSSSSSSSNGKVQISVDVRTNSLLMTASRLQLMLAEKIIEAIDVPPDGAWEPVENSGPYLKVYKVNTADAGEVAKTITAIYDGIVVNEDRSADTIHIWGDDATQREAARLINELDGLGSGLQVDVISLARMDPLSASAMIRSMFLSDGENAPTVEADLYGRRLIVRGTTAHVTQIKSMLAKLGEDGNPNSRPRTGTGNVRTIPLPAHDVDELLPLVEKLWNASNDQSVRIVPNNRPTVRRRFPESAPPRESLLRDETGLRGSRPISPKPVEEAEPPAAKPSDETPAESDSVEATTTGLQPVSVQTDAAGSDDGEPTPPIAITPSGDGIVIVSDDEEALDKLELFVDTLTRAIPPRTQWNVFYLSSADATETATMLEQLIPSASVSSALSSADQGMFGSLTSGITSMGSSLMEMSGLDNAMLTPNTLRIVPDVRSNSLFVAGPPSMVDAVEDLLDVLDESDLPDALRDRRPGTIPVEHADVDDVADIVRELYRDQLAGQNQQQRGGQNPLQMLMQQGGNQRGSRGRQQQQPQMTLSVDNRTSQLVVSASDALFREIETLVKRLDEDARLARRTTRIVPLQYADALVVQNAVTSLIPKVHVGGTPSRRPSPQTQPQGNPGGGDRGGSDAERDAARRFFEQRMRERFGGGNTPQPGAGRLGGGRPGGGRPGGDAGGRSGGDRPGGGRPGGGRPGRG